MYYGGRPYYPPPPYMYRPPYGNGYYPGHSYNRPPNYQNGFNNNTIIVNNGGNNYWNKYDQKPGKGRSRQAQSPITAANPRRSDLDNLNRQAQDRNRKATQPAARDAARDRPAARAATQERDRRTRRRATRWWRRRRRLASPATCPRGRRPSTRAPQRPSTRALQTVRPAPSLPRRAKLATRRQQRPAEYSRQCGPRPRSGASARPKAQAPKAQAPQARPAARKAGGPHGIQRGQRRTGRKRRAEGEPAWTQQHGRRRWRWRRRKSRASRSIRRKAMNMHDRNRFLRATAVALVAITAAGLVAARRSPTTRRSHRPKKPFPR